MSHYFWLPASAALLLLALPSQAESGPSAAADEKDLNDAAVQAANVRVADNQASTPIADEPSAAVPSGAVSARVAWMRQAGNNPFALVAYEPNYFLYTYSSDVNRDAYRQDDVKYAEDLEHHELKFQLSLALPVWREPLGTDSLLAVSYTQVSMWQTFNRQESSPFRETNYEPQVFMTWLTDYEVLGFNIVSTDIGFNHQSNGRSKPMSRSWNRIYANILAERGNLALQFKPWYRINESEDDNPDIDEYMGHFLLSAAYRMEDHVFSARGRYSFSSGRGGLEAGWSYPLGRNVRFYAQVFTGYGETLIDYNNAQTRIGLGVMMNDLL